MLASTLLAKHRAGRDSIISLESNTSLISALIIQLWPQINKVLNKVAKDTIEPIFAEKLPSGFQKMHFAKFDLGPVPVLLEKFVVHPVDAETNSLSMELDINWDSQCDIDIEGLPGGITLGVEDFKFRGRMVVLCKPLLDVAPVVSSLQIAFINSPEIDLDFTGIMDVADWGSVRPTIDKVIHDALRSAVVLPQRIFVKMDPKCDITHAYQRPMGVMRVKLVKGTDLPIICGRLVNDVPDPYCILSLGGSKWQSSTKSNDTNPEWDEWTDFVLCNDGQNLRLSLWDHNTVAAEVDLGSVEIPAKQLLEEQTMEITVPCPSDVEIKEPVTTKVTLECELIPLIDEIPSVIQAATRSVIETSEVAEEEKEDASIRGILLVYVVQARNLPVAETEAESFVKVWLREEQAFETPKVAYDPEAEDVVAANAHVLNPEYNSVFQIPIHSNQRYEDERSEAIYFELFNGTELLGTHTVTLATFLAMKGEMHQSSANIGGSAILDFGIDVLGVPV